MPNKVETINPATLLPAGYWLLVFSCWLHVLATHKTHKNRTNQSTVCYSLSMLQNIAFTLHITHYTSMMLCMLFDRAPCSVYSTQYMHCSHAHVCVCFYLASDFPTFRMYLITSFSTNSTFPRTVHSIKSNLCNGFGTANLYSAL